jgi:arylsulfatase A-like enzyme
MDALNAKIRVQNTLSLDPKWQDFNVPLKRNTNIVERPANQTTLTKRYTEEAVQFIKDHQKRPFFLYFAETFPHVPLFASPEFKGRSARGLYGDAVEEVDWSVGQVLAALAQYNLETNTLVFFTSDNGPWLTCKWNGGSAGLLRDGKGGTWEGGYRVPAIARWPGRIKPGQVTGELASAMDLFNTCLLLGGVAIPKDRPIDGVDLSPVLFGTGAGLRTNQFYYYGDQLFAVRQGAFKAHFQTRSGYSKDAPAQHNPPLLFRIPNDPSEQFSVTNQAGVVAAITKTADEHRKSVEPGKPQY